MVKFKKVYGVIGLVCIFSVTIPNGLLGSRKSRDKDKQPSFFKDACTWMSNMANVFTSTQTYFTMLKDIKESNEVIRDQLTEYNQSSKNVYTEVELTDKCLLAKIKEIHNMNTEQVYAKKEHNLERDLNQLREDFTNDESLNLESVTSGTQKQIATALGKRMQGGHDVDQKARKINIKLANAYEVEATRLLYYNDRLKEECAECFKEYVSIGCYSRSDCKSILKSSQNKVSTPSQKLQLYHMIKKNERYARKLQEKAVKLYQAAATMTEIEKQYIALCQDKKALLDMIDQELEVRSKKR